jgi:hypothetical protein
VRGPLRALCGLVVAGGSVSAAAVHLPRASCAPPLTSSTHRGAVTPAGLQARAAQAQGAQPHPQEARPRLCGAVCDGPPVRLHLQVRGWVALAAARAGASGRASPCFTAGGAKPARPDGAAPRRVVPRLHTPPPPPQNTHAHTPRTRHHTPAAAPGSAAAATATSWRAGSSSSTAGRCRRRRRAPAQPKHSSAATCVQPWQLPAAVAARFGLWWARPAADAPCPGCLLGQGRWRSSSSTTLCACAGSCRRSGDGRRRAFSRRGGRGRACVACALTGRRSAASSTVQPLLPLVQH